MNRLLHMSRQYSSGGSSGGGGQKGRGTVFLILNFSYVVAVLKVCAGGGGGWGEGWGLQPRQGGRLDAGVESVRAGWQVASLDAAVKFACSYTPACPAPPHPTRPQEAHAKGLPATPGTLSTGAETSGGLGNAGDAALRPAARCTQSRRPGGTSRSFRCCCCCWPSPPFSRSPLPHMPLCHRARPCTPCHSRSPLQAWRCSKSLRTLWRAAPRSTLRSCWAAGCRRPPRW